ncbi:MAG: aminotransferase class IV [Actinobacteria bacterium]|nr:aminotransferase class IV [Actinomycetota bacterium]MCG2802291.1 aminotransferase class IV [Cellulomonas sp.]
MGDPIVWSGGRLRSPDEPLVGPRDRGLTGGLGVYESLAVIDGAPFAVTRHLARLARSAAAVGLAAPDGDELREATALVARTGGWGYGRLRITITSGSSAEARDGVTFIVGSTATPVHEVRVVRVPWVRNDRAALVGVKAISTADNLVAARHAHDQGADEAVLANTRGQLCECTTSNVLVEVDGQILTPPLSSGCLGGVTRELLLEWAVGAGLPVVERTVGYESVLDEVARERAGLAVSSTIRGVAPVVALDGAAVAAGPLSLELRRLVESMRRVDLDP